MKYFQTLSVVLLLLVFAGCTNRPPLAQTSSPTEVEQYLTDHFPLENVELEGHENQKGVFIGTAKYLDTNSEITVTVKDNGISWELPSTTTETVDDNGWKTKSTVGGANGGIGW